MKLSTFKCPIRAGLTAVPFHVPALPRHRDWRGPWRESRVNRITKGWWMPAASHMFSRKRFTTSRTQARASPSDRTTQTFSWLLAWRVGGIFDRAGKILWRVTDGDLHKVPPVHKRPARRRARAGRHKAQAHLNGRLTRLTLRHGHQQHRQRGVTPPLLRLRLAGVRHGKSPHHLLSRVPRKRTASRQRHDFKRDCDDLRR